MRVPSKRARWAAYLAAALAAAGLVAACGTTGGGKADGVATAQGANGEFVWRDLVTSDPAAARRFYGELLGWTFEETTAFGRPYLLAKQDGRYVGGIVQMSSGNDRGGSQWLSYMSVANVESALGAVEAAGGRRILGPVEVSGVGRAALVWDSQGAPLGLAEVGERLDGMASGDGNGEFFWMEYLANDVPAALAFYKDLAGYEVEAHAATAVPYYLLKSGSAQAGLFQNPVAGVTPNWLAYVRVADPAALAAKVPSLGGRVIIAPSSGLRDGTLAVIADPTGAVIALQKKSG
ncbi:MAG TPA: VOC family protein [Steroidobacteraceae bacterium]|nr:VOC family protein [Steroidobacteraceae bacterium]